MSEVSRAIARGIDLMKLGGRQCLHVLATLDVLFNFRFHLYV